MNEKKLGFNNITENLGQAKNKTNKDYNENPTKEDDKEEQGDNFENRYKNLTEEVSSVEYDKEITYLMAHIQSEGLQTLINEYGVDAVFKAIQSQSIAHEVLNTFRKDELNSNKITTFSIFEVIKTLEPNYEKRKDLFKKIKVDAKKQGEKIDQLIDNPEEGDNKYDYFNGIWGSGENFFAHVECKVFEMEKIDNIFSKFRKKSKFLNSRIDEFANYVSLFYEENEKIKNQLAKADNDIFRLVENRDKNSDQQIEQLRFRADKIYKELVEEVERISNELNIKFEKLRAEILNDLSKIENDVELKELERALEKAKCDIVEQSKKIKQEIAEKTEPLQKMIDSIKNIYFL